MAGSLGPAPIIARILHHEAGKIGTSDEMVDGVTGLPSHVYRRLGRRDTVQNASPLDGVSGHVATDFQTIGTVLGKKTIPACK